MSALHDRSQFVDAVKSELQIDPRRTAIVTVDMHRGHLDPAVATQPVPADDARRVLAATARALAVARTAGLPVIHVVLTLRPAEVGKNAFHQALLATGLSSAPLAEMSILEHNLPSSRGTELMPEIGLAPSDFVIDNKKTASAFVGTDLDNLLRTLGATTVVLCGVNTNTCVLCSTFDAFNLRYTPVVLSDCVASMYGTDLHEFALQNISRCFGFVLTSDELWEKAGVPVGALAANTSGRGA